MGGQEGTRTKGLEDKRVGVHSVRGQKRLEDRMLGGQEGVRIYRLKERREEDKSMRGQRSGRTMGGLEDRHY